ncbi:twin-arginine translocation signal domain-containing protein, partial [Agrobacterium pusense]
MTEELFSSGFNRRNLLKFAAVAAAAVGTQA